MKTDFITVCVCHKKHDAFIRCFASKSDAIGPLNFWIFIQRGVNEHFWMKENQGQLSSVCVQLLGCLLFHILESWHFGRSNRTRLGLRVSTEASAMGINRSQHFFSQHLHSLLREAVEVENCWVCPPVSCMPVFLGVLRAARSSTRRTAPRGWAPNLLSYWRKISLRVRNYILFISEFSWFMKGFLLKIFKK